MFWERLDKIVKFLFDNKWFVVAVLALAFIVYELFFIFVINKKKVEKKEISRNQKIKNMVTIAIFSSISIVLYLTFKFSLPIFPEFLKLQFSNLALILGMFLLGRKGGITIVLIRTIVVLPFSGTFFVGELADLIIGISIVLIGTHLYDKNKTKKGAIISLVGIALTWVMVSLIANYFMLIPFYINLMFGGNEEVFVSMLKVIPNVTSENYLWKYILFGALPFNALLSIVVCFVTFITYKRLSIIYHKFDE